MSVLKKSIIGTLGVLGTLFVLFVVLPTLFFLVVAIFG